MLVDKEFKVQLSETAIELEDWPGRLSLFAVSNKTGYFIAARNTCKYSPASQVNVPSLMNVCGLPSLRGGADICVARRLNVVIELLSTIRQSSDVSTCVREVRVRWQALRGLHTRRTRAGLCHPNPCACGKHRMILQLGQL